MARYCKLGLVSHDHDCIQISVRATSIACHCLGQGTILQFSCAMLATYFECLCPFQKVKTGLAILLAHEGNLAQTVMIN